MMTRKKAWGRKSPNDLSQSGTKPKILIWDLESTNLNANFGYLLAFGYKWLGDAKAKVISITDFKSFRDDPTNDCALVKAAAEILGTADAWVTWYGQRFDAPMMNTRLLYHKLDFLPPIQHIDGWRIAKYKMKLNSNRLASVTAFLGLEEKTVLSGPIWIRAAAGHKPSIDYVVKHCLAPHHRVLTTNLQWVPGGNLKEGDTLIGFDEESNGFGRKYTKSVVEKVSFAKEPCFSVELGTGEEIVTTAEHQWLVGAYGFGGAHWVQTKNLRTGPEIFSRVARVIPLFSPDESYEAGYLSGILDGEGWLSGRTNLGFGRRPGEILEYTKKILNDYGKRYSVRLLDSDNPGGLGKGDCRSVRIMGPLPERLALLGSIRPKRLLPKLDIDSFGRMERRMAEEATFIKAVRSIGEREIVKIKTSSRTFIAEGYPMHNCAQDVEVLEQVYMRIRPLMTTHPSTALFKHQWIGCPVCGSDNLHRRGFHYTRTRAIQRFVCCDCGAWSNDGKAIEKTALR